MIPRKEKNGRWGIKLQRNIELMKERKKLPETSQKKQEGEKAGKTKEDNEPRGRKGRKLKKNELGKKKTPKN